MKIIKILTLFNLIHHKINIKHKKIRNKIINIIKNNNNSLYDYGEGFFYQSIPLINLKGLRDTDRRIEELKLNNYLKDSEFLDIGTNIGAIPLSVKNQFKYCIGIDHSDTVIKVAKTVKEYLNLKNIKFICADFLKYKFDRNFDVILSLANHSTFDQGIKDSDDYFKKIYSLLKDNGFLILESHSPYYESNEKFLKVVNNFIGSFKIVNKGIYNFGNYYDSGRTYLILKKLK